MKNLKKEVYCESCAAYVDYAIKATSTHTVFEEKTYMHNEQIAYCSVCDNEVLPWEVQESNVRAFNDSYRIAHDIITISQIQEIPAKYNIGIRPLSRVLGWGENTFSRFHSGDTPTRQYNDILKKIYNDPKELVPLLEKNKSKVSENTFNKCIDALRQLNAINTNENSKLFSASRHIIKSFGKIEEVKTLLLKILYYSEAFYTGLYKRRLFAENSQAWKNGPVYSDVYFYYKDLNDKHIEQLINVDCADLSTDEIDIIDNVIKYFGCYSGSTLSLFTHKENPWLITRGDIPPTENCDKEIENSLIEDFFTKIVSEYKIKCPSDIEKYATTMFRERFL